MDGINIEAARQALGELVDRARLTGQPALLTRNGKPAAVLVPVDWFEQAASLLSTLPPRRGYEQYETVRLDGDLSNANVTNLDLRKVSGEVR